MRILHTADLHLRQDKPERLQALEHIVRMVQSHPCDALVIAGDLFDDAAQATAMRSVVRTLLERAEVPVYIAAGNHDEDAYSRAADYGRNTHIAAGSDPVEWQGGELDIVGVPFVRGSRARDLLRRYQGAKSLPLIILHTSFYTRQWMFMQSLKEHEGGGGNDFPLYESDLADMQCAYVALGHWHETTQPPLLVNQAKVAYSGAPVLVADEIGPRYVVLVELENGGVREQFIELPEVVHRLEYRLFVLPEREEQALEQADVILAHEALPNRELHLQVDGYITIDERIFRDNLQQVINRHVGSWRKVTCEQQAVSVGALPMVLRRLLQALETMQPSLVADRLDWHGCSKWGRVAAQQEIEIRQEAQRLLLLSFSQLNSRMRKG